MSLTIEPSVLALNSHLALAKSLGISLGCNSRAPVDRQPALELHCRTRLITSSASTSGEDLSGKLLKLLKESAPAAIPRGNPMASGRWAGGSGTSTAVSLRGTLGVINSAE